MKRRRYRRGWPLTWSGVAMALLFAVAAAFVVAAVRATAAAAAGIN